MRTQITFDFTASNGVPFRVRIVPKNERYERDMALVNDDEEPLVEFYDRRHMHTEHGQFVTRYYASTLLSSAGRHAKQGLDLLGYEPSWKVDADSMARVLIFVSGAVLALAWAKGVR